LRLRPKEKVEMEILAKPKSIFASKAAWGGLIALVSAASPFISMITGVDITQDDINTGVNSISEVTQAVGGLVGFGMVLWSRLQKKSVPATIGSTNKSVEVSIPTTTSVTSPPSASAAASTAPRTTARR
jgi:hypothetical protein